MSRGEIMIKFEHNMLVLNNIFSEDDVEQIDAFAEYVRTQERERIIAILKANRLSAASAIVERETNGSI
jgi:hypothetical protein